MKRTIIRSVILTLSLVAAFYIADKLPEYLGNKIGTDTNSRILIGVGVLIILISLIMAGNWLSQRIKKGWGNNKPMKK